MKTVIYWKTNDRKTKRMMMEELGIRETSVNGESVYVGDVERLREYQREGLIAIRMKDEE